MASGRSELRDRRYKKPSFITPGGSRLSDLEDDDLAETLRSAASASTRQKRLGPRDLQQDASVKGTKRRQQQQKKDDDRGRVGILFKLTVWQHFFLLLGLVTFGLLALLLFLPNPIDPVAYRLESQPAPLGPLAVNARLADAKKFLQGVIRGPESFAFHGDFMYTGTLDGRIVRIHLGTQQQELWVRFGPSNCSTAKAHSPLLCGRPLGLRLHPTNRSRLLVADAYLGLMDVSLETRTYKALIDRSNPVGVTFYDDLDITPDGLVLLSEASTKFPLHLLMHQVLEGSSNGRLLTLNLSTGHVAPVLEGLNFANGVQLHPDGQSVLIAETMAFRITRYYFAGPLVGQAKPFSPNLPVGPDNIRLAPDGRHLWVAGSVTRLAGVHSSVDLLSERTWLRMAAAKMLPGPLLHRLAAGHYGLVLRLDIDSGRIIDSFHDPEGKQITHSSEVHEHNGQLYIGTYYGSYVATLKL